MRETPAKHKKKIQALMAGTCSDEDEEEEKQPEVLERVENFLSLYDFQGDIEVLENDEKDAEESDLISNIFDDANFGNITDEPGSHLTIIYAPATEDTGLTHGFADRRNNRAIKTLRVWQIFRGNFDV
ncbi:hypothetical protein KY290_013839 [Solanum tuberosum]|uniref:Uncharacterized protein n=1 Tax=Solanum tuberosum TaxID=4113 RepID=A0ABQ7VPQ9_SOLTU|nr:hypothetical protein KY290_013839 [Solanum tuberosum]